MFVGTQPRNTILLTLLGPLSVFKLEEEDHGRGQVQGT